MAQTIASFEKEAREHGFYGQFVSIDGADFYITCRYTPGAFPTFSVDDVPTPLGQVAALLENAAIAAAQVQA